ncbi:hypothetical protein CTAM01_10430 [Colletotrichum tamarilloi]|uniref:Secreted protein n=1 Tax=Colletotrichum tamarilloi TaxID=1209934 RepID=A0ABQ9R095_9PEZI|nr:uncharacterized protein CTAM01_10430 [Colletotrichum tamarilloi]KAK1490937.1 hypothetical protein CTAM01_10430 [Colletotrichum tamarilloi]
MSLWMGWDEMLKSIRSLLILYGWIHSAAQRNATPPRRSCSVCGTRMHKPSTSHTQRSIIQRRRQARSSLHSTPYRDVLYYPTPVGLLWNSLYLTVPEAFETVSCPQGHHNVGICKRRPVRDERGESL